MTLSYPYFTVQDEPLLPGRKTRNYRVMSKRNDFLAVIQWHSSWRQFVLMPTGGTVWSGGCLRDIQDALQKIKAAYQKEAT